MEWFHTLTLFQTFQTKAQPNILLYFVLHVTHKSSSFHPRVRILWLQVLNSQPDSLVASSTSYWKSRQTEKSKDSFKIGSLILSRVIEAGLGAQSLDFKFIPIDA